jgi:hypothetical protein
MSDQYQRRSANIACASFPSSCPGAIDCSNCASTAVGHRDLVEIWLWDARWLNGRGLEVGDLLVTMFDHKSRKRAEINVEDTVTSVPQ